MNPDRYTKAVLTIIAAAPVWLCIRDVIPTVHAGTRTPDQQQVRLVDITNQHPLCVKIVGIEQAVWFHKTQPFGDTARRSRLGAN